MASVLCDECKSALMLDRLGGPFFSNLYMGLLTGSFPAIDHTTTLASLAAFVAAWTGYAPQQLTGWVDGGLDADFNEVGISDPVTFLNTDFAPQSVSGWYIFDATSSVLLSAAPYVVPFILPALTSSYTTQGQWLINGPLS